MNSITNNVIDCMKDDAHHYTLSDSGLSWSSNSVVEKDCKNIPLQPFHCDDLTKSLFMNSFGDIGIIQDDDIFSYKSKMEINGIFPSRFRSLNLAKFDTLNFKNSCSLSSIIQDVENLNLSNPVNQPKIPCNVVSPKDNITSTCISNPSFRIVEEMKSDISEKIPLKRPTKRNGVQEYVSSSIKDYQGNKSLNDIVSFIQGSPKSSKSASITRPKITKMPSIKVEVSPILTPRLSIISDSGVVSNNSSSNSKEDVQDYVSSSKTDCQSVKSLNDIVSSIQQSPKPSKSASKNRPKITKMPSIKVDDNPTLTSGLSIVSDSGVASDNSSQNSKEIHQSNIEFSVVSDSGVVSDTSSPDPKNNNQLNIDADSGIHSSPFISLNNSDEDMSQLYIEDFREVFSRKQKKTSSLKSNISIQSPSLTKPGLNYVDTISNKYSTNKVKKSSKTRTQTKSNDCSNLSLQTRDSFHNFLSDQYFLFLRKYNSDP